MASPGVDTFEHDIANEIRQKEASIADIASAVGDIGNTTTEEKTVLPKPSSSLTGVVVILVVCGVIGLIFVAYLFFNGELDSYINGGKTSPSVVSELPIKKESSSLSVKKISPILDESVGHYLENVRKSNYGYSLSITSYSPVYAYMIKNDSLFGDELATAVGNTHTLKKSVSTSTPITASSTAAATSTLITSTSTTNDTVESSLPTTYTFTDVTISNQNMRVATSIYGTVVYAFVNTGTLLISSSTSGILSLKGSSLTK